MQPSIVFSRTQQLWSGLMAVSKVVSRNDSFVRWYTKKPPPCDTSRRNAPCRRAYVDIKPDPDPDCPLTCNRTVKKKGILHKIKLKVIEGGTNFGTPFRRLQCKKLAKESSDKEEPKEEDTKEVSESKGMVLTLPAPRPGLQVSVLGADTAVGQYIALLLKQCSCIKKLRLYEARSCCNPRELCSVVQDLQHINTNCVVQAFSCACFELERCLQNTDIVLMLESGDVNFDMSLKERFAVQAPTVKMYTDAIANQCPKAFIIVCATPIDCMVPLIAETLKETGWYDPRKILGSLAVPEMRASTLAATALSLEPRSTRVPCVGGTEGDSLVPLFSRAVEYFEFAEHNAQMLTKAVRSAPLTVAQGKAAELSEAHALSKLVTTVAHALLCHDVPKVTGFVETDAGQIVSPAKYIANTVEIGFRGITRSFGLPLMSQAEVKLFDTALNELHWKMGMVEDWCIRFRHLAGRCDDHKLDFFAPGACQDRIRDCAYSH